MKHKGLAFFFLVMFALSITPKIYFHEALANHTDGLVCKEQDKKSPCFHRQAFHCHFDDLVVSSPFVSSTFCPTVPPPPVFAQDFSFSPIQHLAFRFQQIDSRGPPQEI